MRPAGAPLAAKPAGTSTPVRLPKPVFAMVEKSTSTASAFGKAGMLSDAGVFASILFLVVTKFCTSTVSPAIVERMDSTYSTDAL